MTPTIGVATVTYKSEGTVAPFLASTAAASTNPVTIVVADNSPSESGETGRIAESYGARFIARSTNDGYGSAMNEAVDSLPADIDFVLISNPDVVLGAQSIDLLVEAAHKHPRGGAFGPRIVEESGETYPSARSLPSLRTGIGHAMLGRVRPSNRWTRRYRLDHDADLVEREAGWLSGACLLVRRSAFDAVSGFDPSYFMYFEDVDFGARLGKAGWENVYVPTATVMHTGGHSTAQNSRAMERVHHQSAYLYLSRKYSAWYLWPLRVFLRAALYTRSIWVARGR